MQKGLQLLALLLLNTIPATTAYGVIHPDTNNCFLLRAVILFILQSITIIPGPLYYTLILTIFKKHRYFKIGPVSGFELAQGQRGLVGQVQSNVVA